MHTYVFRYGIHATVVHADDRLNARIKAGTVLRDHVRRSTGIDVPGMLGLCTLVFASTL